MLLRNHQTVGLLLVSRILLLLLVVLLVVLAVNGLTVGPIPTEVGQLDKLRILRLNSNQLTGKNKVSDVVVDVGCEIRCLGDPAQKSFLVAVVVVVVWLLLVCRLIDFPCECLSRACSD